MEIISLLATFLVKAPEAIHIAEQIGGAILKAIRNEPYSAEEQDAVDAAYKFAKSERKKIFPAEGEPPQ